MVNIFKKEILISTALLLFIETMFACWMTAMVLAGEQKTGGILPIPTPGLVTMVNFGARGCVPCKMMAPIIEDLQKEYSGRVSIIFINSFQNREQAKRFGVRAIPTQIYFDKKGQEVGRHIGFLEKGQIRLTFENLGVPQKPL